MSEEYHFNTDVVHAGYDPSATSTGAVIPDIGLATTFKQHKPGDFFSGGFEYSRSGNPTRNYYEACVAKLERGVHGIAFASGSAALSTIVSTFPSPSYVLSMNCVYGGSHRFLSQVATASSQLVTDFIDFTRLSDDVIAEKLESASMVWIETPTNPTLVVVDIKRIGALCKEHNVPLYVDNTFATPFNQQPLQFEGVTAVVHSVTKFMNGHSDVVGGIVITNDDALAKKLRFLQNAIGAVPSPFDCWLCMRGIRTLHIRMQRHNQNALAVATFLESHEAVERVIYPGLPSHPQHALAAEQMKGFGGMVSVVLKGDADTAQNFLSKLKVFTLAESLGAVESLAEFPYVMTHAAIPKKEREAAGISDSLCRLSVGIEAIEDLVADLSQALEDL